MKNKLLPIFITLIFIIIFVIFYKGLKNTNIYTPEKKINNKIPLFSADLFNSNKSINSTELFSSDKFYLLNIWSSWCVPCRQEHPLLMDLAKNKNIKVIGINYKDNKINAQNFLDELGNPYKNIIFDKEGVKAIEWGAYGVPESFLVQNDIILRKYIGPLNNESIKEIKLLIE
mgnify:FL=1